MSLSSLEPEGFEKLVQQVGQRLSRAVRRVPGSKPTLYATQRHYPTMGAQPVVDARLQFDLRTAFQGGRDGVKAQPVWTQAIFDVLANRKGTNLQIGIGATIPFGGKVVQTRQVLDVVARVWLACAPWLDVLLRKR